MFHPTLIFKLFTDEKKTQQCAHRPLAHKHVIILGIIKLQQNFGYYYAQIYLLDAAGENLVFKKGSDQLGTELFEQGFHLPRGKGIIGYVAETGIPFVTNNVNDVVFFYRNPLLPNTQSELAVPIAVGDNVLGVLDVQQNQFGGLEQEDADLLQSIANQVAVALQNARTYAQTQRRANRETLLAAIGQRIQRTTTTEEALQVAVREMGRALSAENVTIKVGAPKRNGNE